MRETAPRLESFEHGQAGVSDSQMNLSTPRRLCNTSAMNNCYTSARNGEVTLEMAATVAEADVKEQVFTKAELDALRKRLAGKRAGAGDASQPPSPEDDLSPEPEDWDIDTQIIIKFLRAIEEILKFLLDNRIPEKDRGLITLVLDNAGDNLRVAISQLESISSESDELYQELMRERLTFGDLAAKISSFLDDLGNGPVLAVLDSANKILGSLAKAIPVLSPVKEAKELIEHKIKYRGDAGLISLNIYGRE
jgi:hypothetical protein